MPKPKSTPRFKKPSMFLVFFALVGLEVVIFALTFRQLRDAFPPPHVVSGQGVTVGYSHYIGYPFYFDTVLSFILFLSPILFWFSISKFFKR